MVTSSEFDPVLAEHLDRSREWVWSSVSSDTGIEPAEPGVVLAVIEAILADGVQATETFKLQALGVVFGDALSAVVGARWVMVEDDYGRDAALQFGGPDDLVFPVTMISKRVEDGRAFEVRDLFGTVAREIIALRGGPAG